MNILAIDASTKSSGFAVFNEDTKKLIYSTCIKSSSQDTLKRINLMKDKTRELIKEYEAGIVVLEDIRPDYNMRTMRPLMYLQSQIAFLLHDEFKDISLELIVPSSWRAACGIHTGRGIKRTELKIADIQFVKDHFNLEVNDDEADAIGIGYGYLHKKKDFN